MGIFDTVREKLRHELIDIIEWVVARTHRFAPSSMRWQPRALEGWQRTTGRIP